MLLSPKYTILIRAPSEFSSKDLQTVGNYTLGRLIGKGSFGKVYLASHKLTNGSKVGFREAQGDVVPGLIHVWQVVLKSAKKDDANLAREIHHHRQFLHPHIARLYEVIVTETLVWLVLEYCPGTEQLFRYMRPPLSNPRILQGMNYTRTSPSMVQLSTQKPRRFSPSWSAPSLMCITNLAFIGI